MVDEEAMVGVREMKMKKNEKMILVSSVKLGEKTEMIKSRVQYFFKDGKVTLSMVV